MPSLNDSVCICLILFYFLGLCAIVLLLLDKFILPFIPHVFDQYRTESFLMFLTENLATIILFVSYIFAMLVFLMLLIEKIVESLFH